MVESYLDGEKVLIRPFLDRANWGEDWHKATTRFFQPGMHHYFNAEKGMGKTSLMVSLMQTLMNTELSGGREWVFLTNQFFTYRDEEGKEKTSYPKNMIHYNTLKWLLGKVKELKEQGKDVAVVIDDMDRFFVDNDHQRKKKKADPLSDAIRELVRHRRKLGIMVWTASSKEYADFDDWSNRYCASDLRWSACMETSNQLSTNAKVTFPVRDYWYNTSEKDNDFLIPRTSWAYERSEKKKGFFFDREGASTIKIGEGFNAAGLFEALDQTPTADVWDIVSKCTSAPVESKIVQSSINRDAEIAMKLKNMGLTDEAIEWALSVPKTTLRRHVEKCGEVWGVSDQQPYLFRKVKASERTEELGKAKEQEETPS